MSVPKFDTFAGANGQWYWRVGPMTGGRKKGDGGEGYKRRSSAQAAVRKLVSDIRGGAVMVDGEKL